MVAQTGLGKQLADGERNQAESKRKPGKQKKNYRKAQRGRSLAQTSPRNLHNCKQMRAKQSKKNL